MIHVYPRIPSFALVPEFVWVFEGLPETSQNLLGRWTSELLQEQAANSELETRSLRPRRRVLIESTLWKGPQQSEIRACDVGSGREEDGLAIHCTELDDSVFRRICKRGGRESARTEIPQLRSLETADSAFCQVEYEFEGPRFSGGGWMGIRQKIPTSHRICRGQRKDHGRFRIGNELDDHGAILVFCPKFDCRVTLKNGAGVQICAHPIFVPQEAADVSLSKVARPAGTGRLALSPTTPCCHLIDSGTPAEEYAVTLAGCAC